MIGFLTFLKSRIGRYLAIAGGLLLAIFAIRQDAKRDARRDMKHKATEDALKRERERDEIADSIDIGGAADRLRKDWSQE